MKQEQARHDGSPVLGVLVLGTGVVLLLNVLGVLPWDIWRELWRWWPLGLVLAGVGMVLKRVHPFVMTMVAGGAVALAVTLSWATAEGKIGSFNTVTSAFSEPLGSASAANFDIDFGAGTLNIEALPSSSNLLIDASFEDREDGVRTWVDRSGGEVRVDLRNPSGINWLGPTGGQREWELLLSRNIPITLRIDGGASSYVLDLEDIDSPEIDLNLGASSIELTVPDRAGQTDVQIDGGAASIDITIPGGIAARIQIAAGLSSVDIDESRFPKVNDDHVSSNYDTAANRVNIVINAGVSSIIVR